MPPLPPLQLIALIAGVLYGLLALTLWAGLRRRPPTLPLALWICGAGLAGIALALAGLHSQLPAWMSPGLAFFCVLGAAVLRILALRAEHGLPLQASAATALWTAGATLYTLAILLPWAQARLVLSSTMLVIGALVFARHAAAIGRARRNGIGHGLAAAETLLALIIAGRTISLLLHPEQAQSIGSALDLVLAITVAVLAALFGNLGYLGLVLDRSRAAEQAASEVQWAERLRREAAEDRAASLRDLLQQRDELAAERDHLLKLLAHEIRQPLHNASGALQAARAELGEPRRDVGRRATERLQRAQSVLADVRSVLDNTLAAANLLGGGDALYVPDTPLMPLIHQALGDLPETQRRLVRVQWRDAPGSAELEGGLVRLALRNLLRNAFTHGGPAVSALIQFEQQALPRALVISVIDDGVGPPPGWQPAPAGPPIRAAGRRAGTRGLGLVIVREVMVRHGGSLNLQPRQPHGLVARMVFPQSAGAGMPAAA